MRYSPTNAAMTFIATPIKPGKPSRTLAMMPLVLELENKSMSLSLPVASHRDHVGMGFKVNISGSSVSPDVK